MFTPMIHKDRNEILRFIRDRRKDRPAPKEQLQAEVIQGDPFW